MYDLHLHLDGSLQPNDILKAAKEQGIDIGKPSISEIENQVVYDASKHSLTEYLKCFELPLKVMQTPEGVRFAVMQLAMQLKKDTVDCAEIRFAPQLHTSLGFSQEEIVKAAIEGLDYANLVGVSAKLILCLMRGENNFKENEETIDVAEKYLGKGVVALDLAGDESHFKTSDYTELFEYAAKREIPFTIHAGEADGPESVEAAIKMGAKRIGHGIAIAKDKTLMKYVADHEIGVEMCPTSNFQTGAVASIEEYPLFKFLDNGILATINTDNRVVSSTTIRREIELVKTLPGFEEKYLGILYSNSKKILF
jgi:adenosine deaminase